MRRDRRVKRFVGIPDDESVHAVIALGYPDEKYLWMAGRRKVPVRYADLGKG